MPRTLIVGDIHGCYDELRRLLDDAKYGAGDRLVLAGDLVARGPASREVVQFARKSEALGVRGNHEARILAWHEGRNPARLGSSHQQAAASLSNQDWAWLQRLPFTLDLPEHGVRVVHAGMDPGLPWSEQDDAVLITIRRVADADGQSVPWGTRYQGPPHVVFGHDARAGLQLHPWCTGLDSGCVYGGRLTALVLEAGQPVPVDPEERSRHLVSVPAHKQYWFPS